MKLFTIGDSVSQGFMSLAAARTDLSYSTLLAARIKSRHGLRLRGLERGRHSAQRRSDYATAQSSLRLEHFRFGMGDRFAND